MATLEKIRSKSVLLVVIIAVALLAFILGDAITNGRNLFGNNTTVAKVGNDKIEIQEYQQKQQELSQQIENGRRQNPQQYANFDSQTLPQQVVDQLISEKLLNNAVAATGYKTTPEMLRFVMIENPNFMIPEMQQLLTSMQQSGLRVSTPAEAHMVIFQPQSYGITARQVEPFQRAWVALEARYEELLGQMIYQTLLSKTFKANDLDIAAMRRDYTAMANVKVAKKPYGTLDEKQYPVSDDEVKKAYESRKEEFKIDLPTKQICFIAVNVPASGKDLEEATALATTVVAEMRGAGISKDTRKMGLDIQRHEMNIDNVRDVTLKNFLQSSPIDSVSVVQSSNRGFLVAKVNGRELKVDSIEVSTIAVIGKQDLLNKVMQYANSGVALDSINTKFSPDSVIYSAPQWVPLYSENGAVAKNLGLPQATYDSLLNTNGKYIVVNQEEQGTMLMTLNRKSSPKNIVEYETVAYEIHPSNNTLADAREKLQKFVAQNNTASKFVKNAQAAGYNPETLDVNAATPAIPLAGGFGGFYPDSRAVVRWVVMDGKDGEVSKIYQSKDPASPNLYVAAVIDSFEEYVPWNNKKVKELLTAQVRRDKAGDAMVKQYSKGTIDEAAQAMQVEPVDVQGFQSTKPNGNITDNKVKGRIMGSKPSNKLQVMKGDDGVYAFIITETSNEPVEMTDEQFAQMFIQMHNLNPQLMLRGTKKIENNTYKFEQAE